MIHNLELTDIEFERQFEKGNLEPAFFNHEAHIRLAWIHITRYGIDEAMKKIPSQLLNYVTQHGFPHKYNHTLTIAATKVVYHFILRTHSQNFKSFIQEFPGLKTNFQTLMGSHYSEGIYLSEEAKKSYVEPDLLPFDQI